MQTNTFTIKTTETETAIFYDVFISDEYFKSLHAPDSSYGDDFETDFRFTYDIEKTSFCALATSAYYTDDNNYYESINDASDFYGQPLIDIIKTDIANRNLQIDNLNEINDYYE